MATNSKIVQKLWDLNKNARDIVDSRPNADVSGVLPDSYVGITAAVTRDVISKDSATSTDAAQLGSCAVRCDLGTDSSDLGVDEKADVIGELSESDLKKKHDEVG